MFHVKHSDFVFCVAVNFLIVALEQGSGGGEFCPLMSNMLKSY